RTGDLARWYVGEPASDDADGANIEFLGRMDYQVKLHGFRVELGEIEVVLRQHLAVKEAVVIVCKRDGTDSEQRLVAYIAVHSDDNLTVSDVRHFLSQTLPQYMLPTAYIFLDDLPLTPNGKLDRRALPAPDSQHPALANQFVAPRTSTEETLAGFWCDLLHLNQVGVHDNFFELGGHSLKAMQVVSRIRDRFHIEFPLRTLFEGPTIAELSTQIETIQWVMQSADDIIGAGEEGVL
ncbi:MAG: phosphopantetheine-binding protein, partial [Chloroflexota bacterium]